MRSFVTTNRFIDVMEGNYPRLALRCQPLHATAPDGRHTVVYYVMRGQSLETIFGTAPEDVRQLRSMVRTGQWTLLPPKVVGYETFRSYQQRIGYRP